VQGEGLVIPSFSGTCCLTQPMPSADFPLQSHIEYSHRLINRSTSDGARPSAPAGTPFQNSRPMYSSPAPDNDTTPRRWVSDRRRIEGRCGVRIGLLLGVGLGLGLRLRGVRVGDRVVGRRRHGHGGVHGLGLGLRR
jgi:hypothetical protein